MAIFGINPFSNNQQIAVSQQQYGGGNTSSVNQKSESDALFSRLNALDGSFNKNRADIYGTASKITAPTEINTVQPQEKEQTNGLAQQFSNGEISTTDAMEMLSNPKVQALLNNEELLNPSQGKSYNLNDGEVHPVYNEKIFDEVA